MPYELEINLLRRDTASYAAQVRLRTPDNDVERRAEAYPVRFNFEALNRLAADSQAYGVELGRGLFAPGPVRDCLKAALGGAARDAQPLRLRLCIDRWSLKLHRLRWETLRDPDDGLGLAATAKVWFSRHLNSFDMRPIRLRSQGRLRTLVAVAAPADLADYPIQGRSLATLDPKQEHDLIRALVARAPAGKFADPDLCAGNLRVLGERLREEYDILYLVCHGAVVGDEPRLLLEGDDGRVALAAGTDLVGELDRLLRLPRLVVLASCQSAGAAGDTRGDDEGLLAAGLGPRLAEAGIPAVVAMLGNVYQQSLHKFVPAFFEELLRDGQVDRAVAEARHAMRGEPDDWAPVLFTRLIDGRLWYGADTGKSARGFGAWAGLVHQISRRLCVPVLGSGLLEPYVGAPPEVARRLADSARYPLAPALRDDLTMVLQYLSTTNGPVFTLDAYLEDLTCEVSRRFPGLADGPPDEDPAARLTRLLSAAGARRRQRPPSESHQILARLSCPLYVTTNADDLLTDALVAQGKKPVAELYRWHDENRGAQESAVPPAYAPTDQAPLVYQLFGNLGEVESLVLTEDDYFRYLVNLTQTRVRPKPSVAQRLLTQSGLLFLGFQVDDWDFRILLHLLMAREGNSLSRFKQCRHFAVQIDPEDGGSAEPERARQFFEAYFREDQIDIYWGSAEDFLLELDERWKARV